MVDCLVRYLSYSLVARTVYTFFVPVSSNYFDFLKKCEFFYLEAELLYNNDMAKNIKLTCNLTGDSRYVSEEAYEKLTKIYGSE
jgi:hypothetical protein